MLKTYNDMANAFTRNIEKDLVGRRKQIGTYFQVKFARSAVSVRVDLLQRSLDMQNLLGKNAAPFY